jgi:hypothetical protein
MKRDRRKVHEKSSLFGIGAIRSTFTVRGDECVGCHLRCNRGNRDQQLRSDDLRSVHELQDLNVLQFSVPRHVSHREYHTLHGSRVLRIDLVLPSARLPTVPRLPTVQHGDLVSASIRQHSLPALSERWVNYLMFNASER